jgi:hypothetical protein
LPYSKSRVLSSRLDAIIHRGCCWDVTLGSACAQTKERTPNSWVLPSKPYRPISSCDDQSGGIFVCHVLPQSSALAHRLSSREAKAFRTSAWDRPNCRAILDGVTPALNAARTAFTRPCDNGTAIWVGLSIKGRFFIRASEPATLAGSFPRRLASSVVTRRSRSNSWSSRYFMPLAKPLGRIDRREGRAVVTSDA